MLPPFLSGEARLIDFFPKGCLRNVKSLTTMYILMNLKTFP